MDRLDPDNATAYFEVAEQTRRDAAISARRRDVQNRHRARPLVDRARNGLGLLYTQSGDEDEARTTLEAAHSLDPFNLRTTNYLRLLDELEQVRRKESAHFIVMYDAKLDPVIPEYFSDYLESVHTRSSAAISNTSRR